VLWLRFDARTLGSLRLGRAAVRWVRERLLPNDAQADDPAEPLPERPSVASPGPWLDAPERVSRIGVGLGGHHMVGGRFLGRLAVLAAAPWSLLQVAGVQIAYHAADPTRSCLDGNGAVAPFFAVGLVQVLLCGAALVVALRPSWAGSARAGGEALQRLLKTSLTPPEADALQGPRPLGFSLVVGAAGIVAMVLLAHGAGMVGPRFVSPVRSLYELTVAGLLSLCLYAAGGAAAVYALRGSRTACLALQLFCTLLAGQALLQAIADPRVWRLVALVLSAGLAALTIAVLRLESSRGYTTKGGRRLLPWVAGWLLPAGRSVDDAPLESSAASTPEPVAE